MKFKTMMQNEMQQEEATEAQQSITQSGQTSESMSFSGVLTNEDEEMTRSALSTFMAKEEEIQKRRTEVKERVLAQLNRIEQENRRLATIREELEALADPLKKEVNLVQKKIEAADKELKTIGQTCQKKEREYKEAVDAFNEKNKEKVQLVTRLMELVNENEGVRLQKLDELSKNLETARRDDCSSSSRRVNQKSLLKDCCC